MEKRNLVPSASDSPEQNIDTSELIEDLMLARIIRDRINHGTGTSSIAEIAEKLGLDPADFE